MKHWHEHETMEECRAAFAALPLAEQLAQQCERLASQWDERMAWMSTQPAWMVAKRDGYLQQAAQYRAIRTDHVFPPIPLRNTDWCAYYDGCEERCEYGWGPTEAAAIKDLVDNYEVTP